MGKVLDEVNRTSIRNIKKRNPRWPSVRDEHLKNNPTCAVCGGTKKLEVHHIIPFSNDPELELDPNNLITLCESASNGILCHQCVGHAGSYRRYNPNVVEDAIRIKRMFEERLD